MKVEWIKSNCGQPGLDYFKPGLAAVAMNLFSMDR
jgi:hypothetical protein